MLPAHKPHEQLRTEPPKHKAHTDKYVSAFVSGESQVDMSFRNPVLSKSSDHFKVGIDELTVNLSALSMLEYDQNDIVFRVVRRGFVLNDDPAGVRVQEASTYQGQDTGLPAAFQMQDGPAGNLEKWRDAFSFKVDRPFNTMLEFLERCRQISNAVGTYIRTEGLLNNAGNLWNYTIPAAGNDPMNYQHFTITLSPNGQLRFSGNKAFWANFMIEIPSEKYRQILVQDSTQQFISLNPVSSARIEQPMVIVVAGPGPLYATTYTAQGFGITYAGFPAVYNITPNLALTTELEIQAQGNILSNLDRRVTLEVGCSLPLKNSPMVDHGVEAPDFVLGRYMFHQPYTMKTFGTNATPELLMSGLGTRTMQGPKDRVVYHHLQAQQKIQILRLRLWARVRTYDTNTKKWGMKTIVCPTKDIDYWHVRMHFVEK